MKNKLQLTNLRHLIGLLAALLSLLFVSQTTFATTWCLSGDFSEETAFSNIKDNYWAADITATSSCNDCGKWFKMKQDCSWGTSYGGACPYMNKDNFQKSNNSSNNGYLNNVEKGQTYKFIWESNSKWITVIYPGIKLNIKTASGSWSQPALTYNSTQHVYSCEVAVSAAYADGYVQVVNGLNYVGNNNNQTMTRSNCSGWSFITTESEPKTKINFDAPGTYTFNFDPYSGKMSVVYPTGVYGNFDGTWKMWAFDSNNQVTVTGVTAADHEFKVATDNWYSYTGSSKKMKRSDCTNWTLYTGNNNSIITADESGSYGFSWNQSDKQLSVTYPFLCAYVDFENAPYTSSFYKVDGYCKSDKDAIDGQTLTINRSHSWFKVFCLRGAAADTYIDNGKLAYKIDEAANFTEVALADGGTEDNHRKYYAQLNLNDLSLTEGNHTLEFYIKVPNTSGEGYISNGGNNYKLTLKMPAACSKPTTPTVSGAQAIYLGDIKTYTASSTTTTGTIDSYTWSVPTGMSGTSTTSEISVTATATGSKVLSATATNSCGQTSESGGLSVAVSALTNPTPVSANRWINLGKEKTKVIWTPMSGYSQVMIVRYDKDKAVTAPTNGTQYSTDGSAGSKTIGNGTVVYKGEGGTIATTNKYANFGYGTEFKYYLYTNNNNYYSSGSNITTDMNTPANYYVFGNGSGHSDGWCGGQDWVATSSQMTGRGTSSSPAVKVFDNINQSTDLQFVVGDGCARTDALSYNLYDSKNSQLYTGDAVVQGDQNGTTGRYAIKIQTTGKRKITISWNGTKITVKTESACTTPEPQTVTIGSASICSTGSTAISLGGSQEGYTYELYKDDVTTGATVVGTGSAISFSNINTAGTYKVKGYVTGDTSCNADMSNTVTLSITPNMALTSITASATPICINGTSNITANGLNLGGTGGTISYTSSSTAAAKVAASGNNAVVTGQNAGNTTITATVSGGCKAAGDPDPTATVGITVNPNMALESITLSQAAQCIGQTVTITPNGYVPGGEGGKITYSSTNTDVATVSGTTVTVVSAGSTTIKANVTGGCGSAVEQTEGFTGAGVTINDPSPSAPHEYEPTEFTSSASADSWSVTPSTVEAYLSTKSAGSSTVLKAKAGSYTVTASKGTCSSTKAVTVVAWPDKCTH